MNESSLNLSDPRWTFEIEILSMSLEVMFFIPAFSSPLLVQLTGTRTAHARNAIGTKILSLHKKKQKQNISDHILQYGIFKRCP